MVTPVHITKRALAVVGGRDPTWEPPNAVGCTGRTTYDLPEYCAVRCDSRFNDSERARVTCPECLVLLDAELEGRGVEAQGQRAEIEAGR